MTDTELLEMFKEKIEGAFSLGAMPGGTGIRYLWGNFGFSYYVQEYKVLFLRNQKKDGYDMDKMKVVRNIENVESAQNYIKNNH